MRQNKNDDQNLNKTKQSELKTIQEVSLSQKVLELEFQLRNSEKNYQCIKKPIKQFPKSKRSFHEVKSTQRGSQIGILSQKLIPSNFGQSLQPLQKALKTPNVKLKNFYDAYKQVLEYKHKKRMRQFEKSLLKINSPKMQQNISAGHQLIYERRDEIKKRLSNKRLDPSIISNLQNYSTSNRQRSILRTLNPKKGNSYILQTVQDLGYQISSRIRKKISSNKYPPELYDQLMSLNQHGKFYQVKRKCYTEERTLHDDEQDANKAYNKTRNISFRLPTQKIKTPKHLIEKIGGVTYNLPQILDKLNLSDESASISYLVKSLRKPSKSQNSKKQRLVISPLQDFRQISQKLAKNQSKLKYPKYHTQSIERNEEPQQFNENDDQKQDTQYFKQIQNKNIGKYERKSNTNKKRNVKLNGFGGIQGWAVQNQAHQHQNTLFTIS